MTLNLTNLKDLEWICQIALDHRLESSWRERIERYQQLFRTEIERVEAKPVLLP